MLKPFPFSINPINEDEKFMVEALKQAWIAYGNDEVPIGAVLVKEGRIVAKGSNQVEMLKDATAHAEMICLTAGSSVFNNWRLRGTVLYCTTEPCCMCAGAMFLSRISSLIWGAPDLRHGAGGSFIDLFGLKHPTHNIDVKGGVLGDYSKELLQDFFRKKRNRVSTQS